MPCEICLTLVTLPIPATHKGRRTLCCWDLRNRATASRTVKRSTLGARLRGASRLAAWPKYHAEIPLRVMLERKKQNDSSATSTNSGRCASLSALAVIVVPIVSKGRIARPCHRAALCRKFRAGPCMYAGFRCVGWLITSSAANRAETTKKPAAICSMLTDSTTSSTSMADHVLWV